MSANLWKSLWNWLSPPPEQDDGFSHYEPPAAAKAGQAQTDMPKVRGKYNDIRTAVESRLDYLVRHEILEHAEIARRDVLELHYIEIEASSQGEPLLQNFFKDFNPAARQDWIRGILSGNAAVNLDFFAGIYPSTELPNTATVDRHEQMLNQGVRPTYSVHVWGRWVQAASTNSKAEGKKDQPVVFRIVDAQGQRPELSKDTYPLTIGRSGNCAVVINGTFVSGSHCSLHAEQGRIYLEDHSKNGTWLNGKKIAQGQRVELSTGRQHLKLGRASGEAKDCPDIELEFFATPIADTATATPIDLSNATPVVGASNALLAVLSIQDATGNPMRDVLTLPYTVGRASGRDYTTPPAHAGISGLHLSIEEITEEGAHVVNGAHSKNGTALNGELQGAEFFWPFGAEIVLASKWQKDPPVRITLKRPG